MVCGFISYKYIYNYLKEKVGEYVLNTKQIYTE